MGSSEPAVWDEVVPDALRRVLQEQLEAFDADDGEGPVDVLARLLDEPTPSAWGNDLRFWVQTKIERLDPERVYRFVQDLGEGSSRQDRRVSDALASADVAIEMIDGRFYAVDEAAEELDVLAAATEPAPLLHGRYAAAKQPWDDSLRAMSERRHELAVAQAVNALESVVLLVSGRRSIDDGLKKIFPTGERAPLRQAVNQLHNYGSAMPQVRHGSGKLSSLTAAEARGVTRAAAVWIVMLIDLDKQGLLPLA